MRIARPATQRIPAIVPAATDTGVVGVLGDADRLGHALRDEDADDVAADGHQRAQVEEVRAPGEPATLEQLGRPRGPAQLVGTPAPDVAGDEHRERRVREHDPEEDVQAAHRTASGRRHDLCRCERLEADELAGRAFDGEPLGGRAFSRVRRGSVAAKASRTCAYGLCGLVEPGADDLDRRAQLGEHRGAVRRRERAQLEQHCEVIGKLAAGELEAGAAEPLLEVDQPTAALAAVSLRVGREVEAGPAVEVEGVDVEPLPLERVEPGGRGEEAVERVSGRPRRSGRHLTSDGLLGEQLVVGERQQTGEGEVDAHEFAPFSRVTIGSIRTGRRGAVGSGMHRPGPPIPSSPQEPCMASRTAASSRWAFGMTNRSS